MLYITSNWSSRALIQIDIMIEHFIDYSPYDQGAKWNTFFYYTITGAAEFVFCRRYLQVPEEIM